VKTQRVGAPAQIQTGRGNPLGRLLRTNTRPVPPRGCRIHVSMLMNGTVRPNTVVVLMGSGRTITTNRPTLWFSCGVISSSSSQAPDRQAIERVPYTDLLSVCHLSLSRSQYSSRVYLGFFFIFERFNFTLFIFGYHGLL
jgi:hypothetical protein